MQQPPRLVGKRVNRNPIPNQRFDKTLRKADRERQTGETDINKENKSYRTLEPKPSDPPINVEFRIALSYISW